MKQGGESFELWLCHCYVLFPRQHSMPEEDLHHFYWSPVPQMSPLFPDCVWSCSSSWHQLRFSSWKVVSDAVPSLSSFHCYCAVLHVGPDLSKSKAFLHSVHFHYPDHLCQSFRSCSVPRHNLVLNREINSRKRQITSIDANLLP